MDENAIGTEQELMESIQAGLQENFGSHDEDALRKAKKDSLVDMQKSLPDWSLEPPETFLA